MPRSSRILAAFAALMGAAGVGLAAASAHHGGSEYGRIGSEFLILHAAALLGIAALTVALPRLVWAGAGLALGACLFSGDLASRAFLGDRLFPMAAPTGGSLMIVSWLALAGLIAVSRVRAPSALG